ncbi:MAG TPA: D-aminoacyl-tRNA deacylase [Spirochaetia bacterium]|nr:D-aminoacyl-tRNA deacylase [Spirochaetia bacterium]
MRAVVQRVRECSVSVDSEEISSIRLGLLVYLGVTHNDNEVDAGYIADKVANLRVFPDDDGRMNLSAVDLGREIIVVSQFTLYGDVRKGRRPSYDSAARPEHAQALYNLVLTMISERGLSTYGGKFQAKMDVRYVNEGPITILIDSQKQF